MQPSVIEWQWSWTWVRGLKSRQPLPCLSFDRILSLLALQRSDGCFRKVKMAPMLRKFFRLQKLLYIVFKFDKVCTISALDLRITNWEPRKEELIALPSEFFHIFIHLNYSIAFVVTACTVLYLPSAEIAGRFKIFQFRFCAALLLRQSHQDFHDKFKLNCGCVYIPLFSNTWSGSDRFDAMKNRVWMASVGIVRSF